MAVILLPGDAVPGDVRANKKFSAGTNFNVAGTLVDRVGTALVITPSNIDQAIPAGAYGGVVGDGKVVGVAVPAANVKTGTTIAGTAGTMPDNGTVSITPGTTSQSIVAGYHNGSGSVASLGGNAAAGNVLTGTTFSSDAVGRVVAGNMPNRGAPTLNPGDSIPAGYYSGGSVSTTGYKKYATGRIGTTVSGGNPSFTIPNPGFVPRVIILYMHTSSGTLPINDQYAGTGYFSITVDTAWNSYKMINDYCGNADYYDISTVTINGNNTVDITMTVKIGVTSYVDFMEFE